MAWLFCSLLSFRKALSFILMIERAFVYYEFDVSGRVRRMTQAEFYASPQWRRVRAAYIDKRIMVDGGMCEVCGNELGRVVHHTVWLDDVNCNDGNISLNMDLLKYLCQTCHNQEKDPRKARGRCRYSADGEVVCD